LLTFDVVMLIRTTSPSPEVFGDIEAAEPFAQLGADSATTTSPRPGVANQGRDPRTLREASAAATPAPIQRLRVMNSHQILLHSAMMLTSNESPP
jgi:hypothetical protein